MKKGYYIHFDARRSPGVAKKIDMQMRELAKHFEMKEINISARQVSTAERFLRLLPGGTIARTYTEAISEIENPDFLYIRRSTADKQYVQFYHDCKKKWPACKILTEIFTYPYDRDEFMRLLAWPYFFKESHNRKRLPLYIDRYITFTLEEEIFGIPTIRTGNGIDVANVKMPHKKQWNPNEIHLIAVAFMQKHHGYERVLKGMRDYYTQDVDKTIYLHLVGDGPEKGRYRKMVRKYHLEEYVSFYPTTIGDALDALYEKGDIALSALACYKDGADRESSLKSREYMAKGFPMVVGCEVTGLENEYPYVCHFPNNGTTISMTEIIRFYNQLMENQPREEMMREIREKVRSFADMSIVMEPVVAYIEGNSL